MASRHSFGTGYLVAVSAVAAVVLVRLALADVVGEYAPMLLFTAAVVAAALYGGLKPGLLATALGLVAGVFLFLEPIRSPYVAQTPEQIRLVVFLVVGGVISLLAEQTRAGRRRTEQERETLRVTLDSLGDGVITTDTRGRVTSLNPVAQALTGWTEQEGLGNSLERIFQIEVEDACQSAENSARCALRSGRIVRPAKAQLLVARDGSKRAIEDNAAPIRDARGTITGAVLVFRDVTELREAGRRKDQFLAMLAHELRNPLAPIRSGLELLEVAGNDPELTARTCRIMQEHLGQMVHLIDDLLDVSRISRGKIALRKEPVELTAVLKQALESCRAVAENRALQVTGTFPDEGLYLEGDPVRLVQVFSNLLNNACKFTEAGGRIWMTAQRQENDAVVRVKDTGIGIPDAMLSRVFEMFTQADRSLERSQGGLGIGLTLVKSLVEMHGGAVQVTSPGIDKGTEFVVRLPLSMAAQERELREPPPSRRRALEVPAGRRILVADDGRDAVLLLSTLLRKAGCEVCTAHDGLQAVEVAAECRPEVVFLDIGMPNVNGYDAARRIREQPWGQEMVLVAVTGWGQEEDRRRSREAGFDHHMVKPVAHAALLKFLAELEPKSA